jgi:hypothetical protein
LDPADTDNLNGLLEQRTDGLQFRQVAGQRVMVLQPTPLGAPLVPPGAGQWV